MRKFEHKRSSGPTQKATPVAQPFFGEEEETDLFEPAKTMAFDSGGLSLERPPEGTALDHVIETLAGRRAALPVDVAVPIVLEALRALHPSIGSDPQGVVIRSVRPSDVLVAFTGEVHAAHVPGSPASHVYSLGLLLAELLLGRPNAQPSDDTLGETQLARVLHREGVPVHLIGIILRATARRAEIRYDGPRSMAEALQVWLAEAGYSSSPSRIARFFEVHQLDLPLPSHREPSIRSKSVPPLRMTRGHSVLVKAAPVTSSPPLDETLRPSATASLRTPLVASAPASLKASVMPSAPSLRAPVTPSAPSLKAPVTPSAPSLRAPFIPSAPATSGPPALAMTAPFSPAEERRTEMPLQSLDSQLLEIATERRPRTRGMSILDLARAKRSRRLRRMAEQTTRRSPPKAPAGGRQGSPARTLGVVLLVLAIAAGLHVLLGERIPGADLLAGLLR